MPQKHSFTLISILCLTLAGLAANATTAEHPCETDDQIECSQVTECNRLQRLFNFWSDCNYQQKPNKISFDIQDLLQNIKDHPDALAVGHLLLRSRHSMFDPCPLNRFVCTNAVVPPEYATEYFNAINTVSINIQNRALQELSLPLEEQRERINELQQIINTLPTAGAASFGPRHDQYSKEQRELLNELNSYARIMNISRLVIRIIKLDIIRLYESCTSEQFKLIIESMDYHKNIHLIHLQDEPPRKYHAIPELVSTEYQALIESQNKKIIGPTQMIHYLLPSYTPNKSPNQPIPDDE